MREWPVHQGRGIVPVLIACLVVLVVGGAAHAVPPGVPDAPTLINVSRTGATTCSATAVAPPTLPSNTDSLTLQWTYQGNTSYSTFATGLAAGSQTTMTDLFQVGVAYDFRFLAEGAGSTPGAVLTVTMPPYAAGDVIVGTVTTNSIHVTAPDSVPSGATGLNLEFKLKDAANYTSLATGLGANAQSDITGLDPSTAYDIRYVADGPEYDSPGAAAEVTTLPVAPAAPVVDLITSTSVRVTAPPISETGATEVLQYKRDVDATYADFGAPVAGGTQTILGNLSALTTYNLRYRVTGAGGSSDGDVTTVTTLVGPPGAPLVNGVGATSATLTMPALADGATSLDLQQAVDAYLTGAAKPPLPGMLLWLRADAITGQASGSPVAAWPDKSGNSYHATQPTASARPMLVLNAVAGRAAVRFDGTSQFLQFPAGFRDFSAGLSAFVVARPNDTHHPSARFFEFAGADADTNNIVFATNVGATQLFYHGRNGSTPTTNVLGNGLTTGSNAFQLLSVVQQAGVPERNTAVTLYRNGAEVGIDTGKGLPVVTRTRNYLGKSNFMPPDSLFKGDICEVILYNRALTQAEITTVQNYLRKKYVIGVAAPAAPAFVTIAAAQSGGATVPVSSLNPDSAYWFRAVVNHPAGNAPGPATGVTTSPGAVGVPAAPTYSAVAQTRVRVHAGALPARATLMKLEIKRPGQATFAAVANNISGNGFADITGLAENATYEFRWVAVGPGGSATGPSAPVTTAAAAPAGAPGRPTFGAVGVTVVEVIAPGLPQGATSMKLQGKLGSAPSSAYADIATGLGTNAVTTVTGLAPDTLYSFRCVAMVGTKPTVGAGGNVTTLKPDPGAPAGPIFSNPTATSMDITAPALPPYALSLRLEKRVSSTDWAVVASGLQPGAITSMSGLDYRKNPSVRYVAIGQSSITNGVEVRIPLLPPVAAPLLNGSARVTELEVNDPTLADGGDIFTFYSEFTLEIKRAGDPDAAFYQKGHWSTGEFELSMGTRLVANLEPAMSYVFRWKAINPQLPGGVTYSANSNVMTTASPSGPAPATPDAPVLTDVTDTSLSATAPAVDTATTSWLRLERKLVGEDDTAYVAVYDGQTPATAITVAGLTPGTAYRFRYVAFGPGGSTAGATADATTLSQPPGAPQFANIGQTTVDATLPARPAGATTMKLQQLVNGSFVDVASGGDNAIVRVANLAPDTDYIFRCVAVGINTSVEGESVCVHTK